ncbi:recombinase family protein [Mesorhizobium sp. M1322]|uniref:recombinase family protein n=1 Tax=Mesorhizobium sp. M1322 TaxID=2957081 RepID=UPI00333AAE02
MPIGLIYTPDARVVLDPDRQIQDTVRLLFDTFRETGSACAVVRRLRGGKILFPRRIRRGIGKGDVLWSEIDHSRVLQILHNPRYAGAFAYGRTRTAYNARLKSVQLRVERSNWQVLIPEIPEAHEGYISWAEYERNQTTLEQNAAGFSPGLRGRMPRQGSGLLQGRLLCGRCGARMRVHYEPFEGRLRPYYVCNEASCDTPASTANGCAALRSTRQSARYCWRRWRRQRSMSRLPCSRRSPTAWSSPPRCAARSCNAPAMRLNWPAGAT